jgi:serine phosphatase RsbU (regulator of sigma subunit)
VSRSRILVVDDEPGMLRAVERVLSGSYEVRTAQSARQALELLEDFTPQLAILDVRMPEMNGFVLMSRLREQLPGLDVIFMTGAVHEMDEQLIRAIRERAFYFIQKPFDRAVLLTLVERCLELRRLSTANAEHIQRLQAELEEARRFQTSLMPDPETALAGFSLSARCVPCELLGGDFYDWIDAGDGHTTVLLCDASGHGVSAAMMTGVVKSAFHDAHAEGFRPAAVTERVARAIRPLADDRFVTLFCARLGPGGQVEYVNAGHPRPLLFGPPRAGVELQLTGPLVSPAFTDSTWDTARCELGPGDSLLAYTDGLIEARRGDEFFGRERLMETVSRSGEAGAGLLTEVLRRVEEHCEGAPADDDRSLLGLTYDPQG